MHCAPQAGPRTVVGLFPQYLQLLPNCARRSERPEVPQPDSCTAANTSLVYSITSLARASSDGGISRPSAATTIKARWVCEQAHQQMKEELGLDHFEGRSWQGLHRHALMTMIAYVFLQYRRLKTARREKNNQRAAASPNLARRAPGYSRTHRSTPAAAMPALPKMDLQRAAA